MHIPAKCLASFDVKSFSKNCQYCCIAHTHIYIYTYEMVNAKPNEIDIYSNVPYFVSLLTHWTGEEKKHWRNSTSTSISIKMDEILICKDIDLYIN